MEPKGSTEPPVEKHWVRGLDKLYEFRLGRLNALARLTFWIFFVKVSNFFASVLHSILTFHKLIMSEREKKTFLFMKGCQLVKKKNFALKKKIRCYNLLKLCLLFNSAPVLKNSFELHCKNKRKNLSGNI